MNKIEARKIAEDITNKQLKEMFDKARENIKDWTVTSIVNKSFTKGVSWNILARSFKMDYRYHIIAKTNMVREFGEYLPEDLKSVKKPKAKITPMHQDPIFV